ncbi:restriction endonuclease subunit S [Caballeronia sp. dw_19]|uniref:restriction endonuclease subunit S n=1 Tax=Caballeronia sp. dw_19 TaxID=2719791 RepID=UPI001BD1E4BD|nr:restriction endonuclease subunit S [Caballeronia sp. dw_19]
MSGGKANWTMAPLGEVATLKTGPFGSALHKEDYVSGEIPLINPTHIRDGKLSPAPSVTITPVTASKLREYWLAAGDVVMGRRGEMGRCAVVPDASAGWVCGTGSVIVRPSMSVDSTYLQRFLSSPATVAKLIGDSVGSTMVNLNQSVLLGLTVPLPPLAEQKRIADKLDTMLACVDACQGRLDRASDKLRLFRKSVLSAAVSGQLCTSCGGDGKHTWKKARAADVCAKVQSGGTPKSGFVSESGIPFLKVYNIVDQQVAFDCRPQFVTAEVNRGPLAKSVALPGDVLMNIVGPPLGKVAVVPYEYDEWNINQAITLFRPSEKITTGWLYILLCHGENIRDIVNETRGSAGQVNISLSQCRDFLFPVPSIDEQNKIVRKVGELFSLADEIEKRLVAAVKSVERLTPALLAKAFRGELVPQDPNDESAAELLKRLAGQQSESRAGTKRKGSKGARQFTPSDAENSFIE